MFSEWMDLTYDNPLVYTLFLLLTLNFSSPAIHLLARLLSYLLYLFTILTISLSLFLAIFIFSTIFISDSSIITLAKL